MLLEAEPSELLEVESVEVSAAAAAMLTWPGELFFIFSAGKKSNDWIVKMWKAKGTRVFIPGSRKKKSNSFQALSRSVLKLLTFTQQFFILFYLFFALTLSSFKQFLVKSKSGFCGETNTATHSASSSTCAGDRTWRRIPVPSMLTASASQSRSQSRPCHYCTCPAPLSWR